MSSKGYEIHEVKCKVRDLYIIQDKPLDWFRQVMDEHMKYEYHRDPDSPKDNITWYDHIFHKVLTEYNLHHLKPDEYRKVERSEVTEAHTRWYNELKFTR